MKSKVFSAFRQVTASQGLSQSTITVFGNLLATGFSAVALILISRQLGPEKFGEFSIGLSLIFILVKVNELGMNNVILKFANIDFSHEQNNSVFGYILRFRLVMSFLIMVVGLFLTPVLSNVLNFDERYIILGAFTIGLATTYYEYLVSVLQSLQLFVQTVLANFMQAGIKLVVVLGLLVLQSQNSLIYFGFYALIPLLPVLFSHVLLPKWVKVKSLVQHHTAAREMKMLAQHSAVAQISLGLIDNIDVLFIQAFLTTFETGLYAGISRIGLLFAMVAYSLSLVLNARVARYQTKEHLKPFLQKAVLIVLVVMASFLAFIPFAGILIRLTIGPEYVSGLSELLILTGASFIGIACVPFSALFFSFKANWYFSVSGIAQVLIIVVGDVLLVPFFGLPAAALTKLVAKCFLFIFTVVLALVIYRRQYAKSE